MESNETILHPELIMCPSCDVELELDHAESDSQKFTCPACGAEVEITDPPISKELQGMIKHGKILVTVWDKIDCRGPIEFPSWGQNLSPGQGQNLSSGQGQNLSPV